MKIRTLFFALVIVFASGTNVKPATNVSTVIANISALDDSATHEKVNKAIDAVKDLDNLTIEEITTLVPLLLQKHLFFWPKGEPNWLHTNLFSSKHQLDTTASHGHAILAFVLPVWQEWADFKFISALHEQNTIDGAIKDFTRCCIGPVVVHSPKARRMSAGKDLTNGMAILNLGQRAVMSEQSAFINRRRGS